MYNTNYKTIDTYYKAYNGDRNDKDRFLSALESLKISKDDSFIVVTGFSCRIQLFKYLATLDEDVNFIAFTDREFNSFESGKKGDLLVPFNFYFRGSSDKIIKAFNEEGFYVYWSESIDDSMLLITDILRIQFREKYNNYDYRTRRYDLY